MSSRGMASASKAFDIGLNIDYYHEAQPGQTRKLNHAARMGLPCIPMR